MSQHKIVGVIREVERPKITYSLKFKDMKRTAPMAVLKGNYVTLYPTSKLTVELARHLANALEMAANDLESKQRKE